VKEHCRAGAPPANSRGFQFTSDLASDALALQRLCYSGRILDAEWKRVVGINNQHALDFTAKTGLIFPAI